MKVIFTELAKEELTDAVAYYEFEEPGLGKKFQKEIKSAITNYLLPNRLVY